MDLVQTETTSSLWEIVSQKLSSYPWFLAVVVVGTIMLLIYDKVTKLLTISRRENGQGPKWSKFDIEPADNFGSKGSCHGIDVIFVHGLGSNPDTTWGSKKQKHPGALQTGNEKGWQSCWVTDFLPEDVPEEYRKDVRLYFYNYDSYYQRDAPQERLQTFASNMLRRIELQVRKTDKEKTRSLIFVGHSYGGLVIKKALVQAKRQKSGIFEQTKAIFFLGTPHRGSQFSIMGWLGSQLLRPLGANPSIPGELVYDSTNLMELHEEFIDSCKPSPSVTNFYETRKSRLFKIWFWQWEEMCVKEQSATYSGPNTCKIGLPVDHYGLNKFHSRKDENYQAISKSLIKIIVSEGSRRPSRIYSVPQKTVENFTARNDLSDMIKAMLKVKHENNSVPHALAIHGLGGIGKTQLALKCAEDARFVYNTVLWIDATDEETMKASFRRCSNVLGLKVDESREPGCPLWELPTVLAVKEWLLEQEEENERWLLIVDNADDLTWGIKKVLPEGPQGSIIITSRDSLAPKLIRGGCESIQIGPMEPKEARALLLQDAHRGGVPIAGEVEAMADELAEILGYLPIAVSLAGVTIGNDVDQEFGLCQYLEDYKTHQDEMLQSDQFRGLTAEDKTVWTVWDTTIRKLEEWHPDIRPGVFLSLLAKFRGSIHDEIIRRASLQMEYLANLGFYGPETVYPLPGWLGNILKLKKNGEEWDPLYYTKAWKLLLRYNLIQRTEEHGWPAITMHNLVRWRASRYQDDELAHRWQYMVIMGAITHHSMNPDPNFRYSLLVNLPDLGNDRLNSLNFDDAHKSIFLASATAMWRDHGFIKEADDNEIQFLEIRKRLCHDKSTVDQEGNSIFLHLMLVLAKRYRDRRRLQEAEELGEKLVLQFKDNRGEDHSDTILSISELAKTYKCEGKWAKAQALFEEVITKRTRILGPDNLDTLSSLSDLASVYQCRGMWRDAGELYRAIIEKKDKVLGPSHPETLDSLEDLAVQYQYDGNWDEVFKLRATVVATKMRRKGEKDPSTLASQAGLGMALFFGGMYQKARITIRDATTVRIDVLGGDHVDTLRSTADYYFMTMLGGRERAADNMWKTIELLDRMLGYSHPTVLECICNMAFAYAENGMWDEAWKKYDLVIMIQNEVLGPNHPETIETERKLAEMWSQQPGQQELAISAFIICYRKQKQFIGEDHPQTIATVQKLREMGVGQSEFEKHEATNGITNISRSDSVIAM
ncbi:hypothetical protein GQ43DRAFT_482494 [Delitschia confertaspora ATCC 74209]|uniref:GPI inositol-deacylase n=1 Tax=Delitschia confertaspora ATCC 74209 TaxID=1513339 RepID=A0A9P4JHN8_9PLEO|nr:hypothetical protein GQ43DRAFT_482494 [Delitschia confertaspora ATCC 74209]